MVEYLPKWSNIDKLVNMIQFVGVKRPGFQIETPYPLVFVDVPILKCHHLCSGTALKSAADRLFNT